MIVDDPYMVRIEALQQLGATGEAFRDLAKAWMPKGETPSLRDYLAAFALAGHLSVPEVDATPDYCAKLAYRYADEMLKARGI